MHDPLIPHITTITEQGGLFRFGLDDGCAKTHIDLHCDADPRGLGDFALRSINVHEPGSEPAQLRYFRVELRPRLALTQSCAENALELFDEETGDTERAELNDDGDIAVLTTTKADGLVQRREFVLDFALGKYVLLVFTEERDGVCETALLFDNGKLNKKLAMGVKRKTEAYAKDHAYACKLFGLTVTYRFDE